MQHGNKSEERQYLERMKTKLKTCWIREKGKLRNNMNPGLRKQRELHVVSASGTRKKGNGYLRGKEGVSPITKGACKALPCLRSRGDSEGNLKGGRVKKGNWMMCFIVEKITLEKQKTLRDRI